MSLKQTLTDKAEATWQIKENTQEKAFMEQIDIFSHLSVTGRLNGDDYIIYKQVAKRVDFKCSHPPKEM